MLAQQIVDEVLSELHGRGNIGDELDLLKHDAEDEYTKLKDELQSKVEGVLKQHNETPATAATIEDENVQPRQGTTPPPAEEGQSPVG